MCPRSAGYDVDVVCSGGYLPSGPYGEVGDRIVGCLGDGVGWPRYVEAALAAAEGSIFDASAHVLPSTAVRGGESVLDRLNCALLGNLRERPFDWSEMPVAGPYGDLSSGSI